MITGGTYFVFLVDGAHECSSRWQDLVDKDEYGFLRRELDALANNIDKLANSEVSRDEVFLLVDSRNVRFLDFLADHLNGDSCVRVLYYEGEGLWKLCLVTYRNTVGVLLSDTLCFSLALLEGVLILELGTHFDGRTGFA